MSHASKQTTKSPLTMNPARFAHRNRKIRGAQKRRDDAAARNQERGRRALVLVMKKSDCTEADEQLVRRSYFGRRGSAARRYEHARRLEAERFSQIALLEEAYFGFQVEAAPQKAKQKPKSQAQPERKPDLVRVQTDVSGSVSCSLPRKDRRAMRAEVYAPRKAQIDRRTGQVLGIPLPSGYPTRTTFAAFTR